MSPKYSPAVSFSKRCCPGLLVAASRASSSGNTGKTGDLGDEKGQDVLRETLVTMLSRTAAAKC